MKLNSILAILLLIVCNTQVIAQNTTWPDPIANDVIPYATGGISHGPLLGRVTDHSIRIWIRTRTPTPFRVLYGTHLPLNEKSFSASGSTTDSVDNTGKVTLKGLSSNTKYFYAIQIGKDIPDIRFEFSKPWPSFKTLPNKTSFIDKANNPDGLYNVKFAIGHCASQDPDKSGGSYTSTPAYDMIRRHHADEVMFALVNGDVIYEELRNGSLKGIRDNYKLYFSRGRSFSELFRSTPALFTFDDHDVGWDIHGCGQIGKRDGKHLIRDLGLRAYEEYLSWANYRGTQSGQIRFGIAQVEKGSHILFDPKANFLSLNPNTVSTVHLGNYTRHKKLSKRINPPKNAGVYGLKKVIDKNHLKITPPARTSETLSYSIGTHHYYDWKMANCHFFALDTRGERSSRNPQDRNDPKLFLLSEPQEKWLLDGIQKTDAEFIFIISPDPWIIYHTAAHVGGDDKDDKGDGFPSFLYQRERLIKYMDAIDKPILIFTGDVHASASIKITDNIWEMMCGPLGSTGHPLATLGNPPTGGLWKSMGRDVSIRWISGFPNNLPYQKIRNTYYGIVQVNNILKVGSPSGGYQFNAYAKPQVVVRWHDGYTGKLVYAESIIPNNSKD